MNRAPPLPPESHDLLGEAVHWLRLSGTFYSCAELTEPWGIALPAVPGCMMFHVVSEGRAWLEVPGTAPCWLEAGTLALVTRGTGHAVRSAPEGTDTPLFDIPAEKLSDRCERFRHGGTDPTAPTCRATCGVVRFEHAAAKQLVDVLPPLIVMSPSADEEGAWLASTIAFVAREAARLLPGADAVITGLADILVIQAVRRWLASSTAAPHGWLAALSDPQLGRALALIHGEPGRAWEIATLAKAVGMSRSAFAARFSRLVGRPVMTYLADLRLRLAHEELRQTREPIVEIAERCGYRSESSFTRAFGRAFGQTPSAVRRARA